MMQICEYQDLVRGCDIADSKFDSLLQLVLSDASDSCPLMEYHIDSSGRQCLKARNYVGVVVFADDMALEILPKYAGMKGPDEVKRIFTDMLSYVYDLPYRESGQTELGKFESNPFEFFISSFLDLVDEVVRRGIRSAYSEHEDNEYFLRGQIKFMENERKNMFHRERFFVKYDVFEEDRPENRLIKATLMFLRKVSTDDGNMRRIRSLIAYFDNAGDVCDVDTEMRMCIRDRNLVHYAPVLRWCDVFLHNMSFTTFSGSDLSYTFLFPMERVFESYMAKIFVEQAADDYDVQIQDTSIRLFDEFWLIKNGDNVPISPNFSNLRPDIVLKQGERTIIIDTKWKNISSLGDVSSSDLYQVYSYACRYSCNDVVLLYPKCNCNEHIFMDRVFGINLRLMFVDLSDIEGFISHFFSSI